MSQSRSYATDLAPDHIRLLTLQPTIDASVIPEQIECTMQVHKLGEAPAYYALSYMWGSITDYKVISLNGRPRRIGRNLHDFLCQLRTSEPLTIWVDAICIDQDKDAERTQEVAIMGRIYSSAETVLAWLGDAADRSDELIDLLMALNDEGTLKEAGRNRVVYSLYRTSLDKSLFKLCVRSYWERAWIVQEVALARKVLLYCGSRRMPCEILIQLCCGWSIQTSKMKAWRHWREVPRSKLTLIGYPEMLIFPDLHPAYLRIEHSVPVPGYDDHRSVVRPFEVFGFLGESGPHFTFSKFVGSQGWCPELLPAMNTEYAQQFGLYPRDLENDSNLLLDSTEGRASFVEDQSLIFHEEHFDPKLAISTILVFWTVLRQTCAGLVLQARSDKSTRLDELISSYSRSKCSDVRDHIYAMLSMAADYQYAVSAPSSDQLILRPDYGRTAAWLLLEVVQFCKPQDPVTFGRTLTEMLGVGLAGFDARPDISGSLVDHVMKIAGGEHAGHVRSKITISVQLSKNCLLDLKPRHLKTSADDIVRVFALDQSVWSGPTRELLSVLLWDIDEPFFMADTRPYYVKPDKLCVLIEEPAQDDVLFHVGAGELFLVARPAEKEDMYTCIGFGGTPEAYSSTRWSPVLREHLHLTWWLGKEALTISQPDDNPGNFMVVMAVPIFYLLLDSSTQDSEVMRFTSMPGWPHPDASRR